MSDKAPRALSWALGAIVLIAVVSEFGASGEAAYSEEDRVHDALRAELPAQVASLPKERREGVMLTDVSVSRINQGMPRLHYSHEVAPEKEDEIVLAAADGSLARELCVDPDQAANNRAGVFGIYKFRNAAREQIAELQISAERCLKDAT